MRTRSSAVCSRRRRISSTVTWRSTRAGRCFLSAEFVRRFRGEPGLGRIVNFTSNPPLAGEIAHAASKGAIEWITISAAVELGHRGITVNAVDPGRPRRAGCRRSLPRRWSGRRRSAVRVGPKMPRRSSRFWSPSVLAGSRADPPLGRRLRLGAAGMPRRQAGLTTRRTGSAPTGGGFKRVSAPIESLTDPVGRLRDRFARDRTRCPRCLCSTRTNPCWGRASPLPPRRRAP
jgi:NAD(P)-dependent dehydrogenase (short-subunit alcohol dehydrogenase family)